MPDPQAAPAAAAVPATPAATPAAPIDVRETVKAAFDKSAETIAKQPDAPKPEVVADDPAKPPVEQKPEAAAPEAAAQAAEQKLRTDRIPPGWKGGAAGWHALPPDAKTFIADRERQYNQGIQRYAEGAKFAGEMVAEFQPYEALLRSVGATPQMATRFLLDKYYTIKAGTAQQKAQLIAEMAADAGVDLSKIAQGEVPQVDPTVAQLQEQVRQLTGWIQGQHQSAQTAEQQSINSAIDTFAADPAHEHFETLRPIMARLLQAGQASDLKDAYEQASYLHPDVRASLLNQRQAQDAEKRKKQAEQSQAANVSLTGAPPAATVADAGDLSVRALVAKQFAKAGRI
jgi:hypothetical protein